jgi:phosphoesterase RecJ-like protein
MPIDWQRLREIVAGAKRFVLTSHVRPDCDALGSELGMAGVLESLGKDVRIINAQTTPDTIAFIDPLRKIQSLDRGVTPAAAADTEVLIVLDTSAWAQLGAMGDVIRATRAKKLVIDHHASNDDLGAEQLKDVSAEATGRLVVDAAHALGAKITAEIAQPLFAAIATDTGWFRFASTTADTYRYGSELVAAGAVPHEIYRQLYEQDTLARIRLRGKILTNARAELDGRLIHTYVLSKDFAEVGAALPDTEDAINLTLAVRGTEAAVILVEQPDGRFKISFRSRGKLDCSKLAEQFGGGGHAAAAGATVAGPFEQAQSQVLDAVRARMA